MARGLRFSTPACIAAAALLGLHPRCQAAERPHIIFVMADDMGWGQTGYRGHPLLKTPHLDAMAANGLQFERFYAGGPVCSPTRASVLTGRSPDRAGVLSHGYALRFQEKTISQALQKAGYVTGHFGKWHLNGYRGAGVPIFADDPRSPDKFGFDEWVSVSNFYDWDPLMSRAGSVEEFQGDSSEIAVAEAIKFLDKHRGSGRSMFAVIWYGTPHKPFKAAEEDKRAFGGLNEVSANHHGELVAMDRSLGMLRTFLRERGLAENTFLVFCSDNGGLPGIVPDTVGGLRGFKGSVFEGGLRVPGIIEWPAVIKPRVTHYPACVMDLLPTVAEIVGLPASVLTQPLDGLSLVPLFSQDVEQRKAPIGFRYQSQSALVGDQYKLVTVDRLADRDRGTCQLYDLVADPQESRDLSQELPDVFASMQRQLLEWNASVDASFAGSDYPEGRVTPADPEPINWFDAPQYQPFLAEWCQRWEYRQYRVQAAVPTRSLPSSSR
jgi:arylsulfatase A-like enzyme